MKYFALTLGNAFAPFRCFLDPLIGSALVTGGASLLGSLFDFGSQKSTNKMQERMFNTQMDYVKAAEQRQYDYMDKAWNRETAYNSPVAQRARFEAAGLNPAMMMEGQNAVVGSMGEPSSPSAPSPPTLVAPQLDLSGIGQAIGSYYQNASMKAQMDKTANEAAILGVDLQYSHQKHQLELRESLGRINKLANDSGLSDAQRKYYNDLAESLRQQITFNDASFNARLNQENKKAYVLDQQGQLLEEEIIKAQVDNFWNDLEHELNVSIARSTKKRIDTEAILNGTLNKKEYENYKKIILEADGLTPGTPQWEQKERQIDALVRSSRRVNLPFGVSFPDEFEKEVPKRAKKAARKGRLF